MNGILGRAGAPIHSGFELSPGQFQAATDGRLCLVEAINGTIRGGEIAVQTELTRSPKDVGILSWIIPPGPSGDRTFLLKERATRHPSFMVAALERTTGQWNITEGNKPVLRYNYRTNEPGEVLGKVSADNRKYARARSDYIHPLYGPDGEEMTKDWSLDHPHHRGIYWAWPEVEFQGERGDLHALQRVFARPTGQCAGQSGPVFAQIEAENLWLWEDREPIVRERAIIRTWRTDAGGRTVDLEFHFTALKDGVTLARRETKLYGGLNVRLSAVKDQRIEFHTNSPQDKLRMGYAELFGTFPGGKRPVELAILQRQTNPDYPGDWVKYPELNWFQPTFPAAGTRYALRMDQPLILRYRLRIQWNTDAAAATMEDQWNAYPATPDRFILP